MDIPMLIRWDGVFLEAQRALPPFAPHPNYSPLPKMKTKTQTSFIPLSAEVWNLYPNHMGVWIFGTLPLPTYKSGSVPVCTCMCLIDSGWLLAHPGMRSKSNPIEMLVNAPLDCESKIAREEIQENIVSSDNLGNLPSGCFSMLSSTRLVTSVSK